MQLSHQVATCGDDLMQRFKQCIEQLAMHRSECKEIGMKIIHRVKIALGAGSGYALAE